MQCRCNVDAENGGQRMNKNSFKDLAVETVKNACEKYWLDKDVSYFMKRLYSDDSPMLGMDMGDEDGFYKIEEATYSGMMPNDAECIVTAKLVLYDTEKVFKIRETVNVMAVCVQKAEEICFTAVHMAAAKPEIVALDTAKSPGFYYKKLMKHMCDLLIEGKAYGVGLRFDEDEYYNIFHERRQFTSMDQWFWHICENYVVEQDLEKLDLFRAVDVKKRVEKEELVDTTFRIKRDDDQIVWLQMVVILIANVTGESLGDVFIMIKDCTKEMTEKMKNLEFARKDYLTGLCNRRYTEERIGEYIKQKKKGIFILMDIDKFKPINDSYGHMTGDEILIRMSKNVSKYLTKEDVFGRLGGDEFVLWLAESGDREADKTRIWEVFENSKFSYTEKNVELEIHCSAGVVFHEDENTSFAELYEKADKAMYQAKGAGRNSIVIA